MRSSSSKALIRTHGALAALLLGSSFALAACGGGAGDAGAQPASDGGAIDTGSLPEWDSGPSGSDSDGGGFDSGPRTDSGSDACSPTDDPDDLGIDSNCDGADGVVGRDLYVNGDVGLDSNKGDPARPLKSITAALKLLPSGAHVMIARGTYSLASIDSASGWKIVGGYEPSFKGAPKRESTTLSVPSAGLFISKATDASVAHLMIVGADAEDPKSPTAHALRTSATKLSLDDVVLRAGSGLSGSVGTDGLAGSVGGPGGRGGYPGRTTCDGVTSITGASPGQRNDEGYPPGDYATKTPAHAGSAGHQGTAGADGPGVPGVGADSLVTWGTAADGQTDASNGYGGAGGYYPAGGSGGGGGCAGKPGTGGAGGGGSIVLLVLDGDVTLTRSLLHTGFAGAGGAGGAGGPGGAGGHGDKPGAATSMSCGDAATYECPLCLSPSADPTGLGCSGFGGPGGAGGIGGHGGGGAGGWALGVVTLKSATATIDSATVVELGKAGVGGANGISRGPDGEKHASFHID